MYELYVRGVESSEALQPTQETAETVSHDEVVNRAIGQVAHSPLDVRRSR